MEKTIQFNKTEIKTKTYTKPPTQTIYTSKPSEGTRFTEPSKTKSEFLNECDIDAIVKRAQRSGELPLGRINPQYADVSGITNYQEIHERLNELKSAFDTIPSELRLRFKNDPSRFFEYIQNPKNDEEAIKLGLKKAKPAPPSTNPPVTGAVAEKKE